MSALVVERADGCTVQDGGRVGAARYGVPRSGPMDVLSHRLAARLAGADTTAVAGTAAIEVGPLGAAFRADGADVTLAVAGEGATLDLPTGRHRAPCVVVLPTGATAEVHAPTWAYVVPTGALDVAPVLGSRSGHPRSGLGPSLADGDRVALGPPRPVRTGERVAPVGLTGPLTLLPGPQRHAFDDEVLATLVEEEFRTTSAFDRMAHRLDGPPLTARDGHDVVSDGVVVGALQVPGDAQVLVLTADHQPTGGYPKPAVLGTAALARFVRLPPATPVRFRWRDVDAARAELRAALAAIERCVAGPVHPAGAELATSNLVDGVTDGR